MSEQSNMSSRLREGIDAAKRGDKLTARRLLQQVLSIDGDNELALMWMASVVDTVNERRFFLERALSINPNNARAREALRRLGVEDPQPRRAPAPAASDFVRNVPVRGGTSNFYLIAAAVVAFVVIAVIVAALVSSLQQQTPTPIAPQVAQATFAAFINPSATPTEVRRAPTLTVLPGIVVTLDPNLITPLPPTFTPTPTPPPTETLQPTETPIPLSSYTIIYSDIEPGAALSSLYRGNADGTGENKLEAGDTGGFAGLSYDPTGRRIAFTRVIADAESPGLAQLFIAPANAPAEAVQITSNAEGFVANPSWSPDGSRLVYSSGTGQPQDEEIWIIDADGSNARQLTNNEARDFDPQFSPDGERIVFASELNSPDFSEIYVMDADGDDVTQLTEVPNSYSPTWSPDGTRIAFVNDQQGDGDIYVMDADGERTFLLTVDDGGAEDRDPAWSPDGRWIVFATNRDDEEFRWYAIDLQGDLQPVTVTGRNPESLSFVTG